MRKILAALALISSLFALPARADFTAKDASLATITFKNPAVCSSVVCVPVFQIYDGTNVVTLTTAGADAVSNTLTGVPMYARNLVFNGTTWDRWTGAVTLSGTLPAFAAIPAFKIDQTTPGTTNLVSIGTNGTVNPQTAASWGLGATAAAVPANAHYMAINTGGNLVGWTGAVTNAGTFVTQSNGFTSWAGGTLGAMANYGTSPGAVLVPGANVFVTNSVPTGRNVSANASPTVPTPALTTWHLIAANTTNATSVKGSAATLFSCQLGGIAGPAFLKIYNKATAPTVGTDVPVKTLIIPVASTAANGAGSNISFGPGGLTLSTGFAAAVTGVITDADATAVAAASFALNCDYE